MKKRVGLLNFGEGILVKIVKGEDPKNTGVVWTKKGHLTLTNGRYHILGPEARIVPEYSDHASYDGAAGKYLDSGFKSFIDGYDKQAHLKPYEFGQEIISTYPGHVGYIIHVVTIGAPAKKQFETVFKAVFNAICVASDAPFGDCNRLEINSIAMPFDLGANTLTPEQNAQAIIGAIDSFARCYGYANVNEVVLCVKGGKSLKAANKVLTDGSYRDFSHKDGQSFFNPEKWIKKSRGREFWE